MENSSRKAIQIIRADENNKIIFEEQKFLDITSGLLHKFLNKGVVGQIRVGKSTELNNNYEMLTGNKTRLFSELNSGSSDTRGIWAYSVKWEEILQEWKQKIMENFSEPIDIILLDCEGTGSSNNVSTSKLYLINMLISSVINIHVPQSINQEFVTKLSEALITTNQIISNQGKELKEILPALFILVKNMNVVKWENARNTNPNLVKYEDLLKSFDNLYNYYNQFPHKETVIIATPKKINGQKSEVTCKNSTYWKNLESTLNGNLKSKKLKSKEELISLIKNIVKLVNQNNLMNVKTELEIFYQNLYEKEKNDLFYKIFKNSLDSFSTIGDFSGEAINSLVLSVAQNEFQKFVHKVSNLSCNWIFNSISKDKELELKTFLDALKELYLNKKIEYQNEYEAKSKIVNVTKDVTREITNYDIVKNHGNIEFIWSCCGNTDEYAKGCKEIGETFIVEGSIFEYDKIKVRSILIHNGNWGEFCIICRQTKNSPSCKADLIKKTEKYNETVITGSKKIYTMEEWSNSQFKEDAYNFFMNKIRQLS